MNYSSTLLIPFQLQHTDGFLNVFLLLNVHHVMLSFIYFHIGGISFGLACGAALPSQWRGYIRPFIQFEPMFSPCQINSHLLGQCCVQVLRRERRVWMKSTNNSNMHGSPQLAPLRILQRALFLPLSLSLLLLVCSCSRLHDRRVLLGLTIQQQTKQKYWPFKPDDTVNMGKVRQLCVCFI